MDIPRLHLVTPPSIAADVVRTTERALAAGAPLVQVRTKGLSDRARYGHVARLRQACADAGAVCLVNDRVDLALAVSAHGVHVGDDDLPAAVARRLLGDDAIVGVTCRNADDARRAVDAGATYLGVGPAYVTRSKVGLPPPLGPKGVAAVAAAVDVPVIAIAGVTEGRVPTLLDAGAWGVAVVGAVYSAPDPEAAVGALLDRLGVGAGTRPGR